jgi:hypothetical protein
MSWLDVIIQAVDTNRYRGNCDGRLFKDLVLRHRHSNLACQMAVSRSGSKRS